jgi:hypothetical protein
MQKTIIPLILILLFFLASCTGEKQDGWQIADNPILTEWSADVDPAKPWPEYPRPDMLREKWLNINGLWQYAVTPRGSEPEQWEGKILVPYPIESALSGVKRRISEEECLWYKTDFKLPSGWKNKRILLHFEASDWETKVWIDGKTAGTHRGGYDPFCFDISEYVRAGKKHELRVSVWDPGRREENRSMSPTEYGTHPQAGYGKRYGLNRSVISTSSLSV